MALKSELFVELNGFQIEQKDLIAKAKTIWTELGNKVKDLNDIKLYYKPDERKCYYIFNNSEENKGSFDI